MKNLRLLNNICYVLDRVPISVESLGNLAEVSQGIEEVKESRVHELCRWNNNACCFTPELR